MESLVDFATLKTWGPSTFVAFIILLILTDKLVWGGRLVKVEKQRDEWQDLALRLLGVADRMVGANEQAVAIVDQKLPPSDLVAEAIKRTVGLPESDDAAATPPEGGGFRDAARLATEATARHLRREG